MIDSLIRKIRRPNELVGEQMDIAQSVILDIAAHQDYSPTIGEKDD